MTGIWLSGAFLASAAFGWRMALLVWLLCGAVWLRRRRAEDVVIVVVVGAAAAVGAFRTWSPPTIATPSWVGATESVRGQIVSSPASTGRGQSFILAVTEVEIGDDWRPASGALCVLSPPVPRAGLGDRIVLFGAPEAVTDQSLGIRSYLGNRGCGATVFARFFDIDETGAGWQRGFTDVRNRISDILQGASPGDSGALLSGLVTGDDHALTDERRQAFLRTGTTHITAVSGSNVALVVSILVTLGGAGGWRRHLPWQFLVVLAIWSYAVLVGGEPPVVRAALVASAAIVAVRVGRRPDFVTLIGLAAVAMVLIEPAQIWSLSFQLSFAASLGIVLVMAGLANDGQLVGPAAVVRASIAAQIATLPIVWFVFGQVSLTSLPANLLIAPLIVLTFPLAALTGLAGLIWPPLAMVLVLPARLGADLIFLVVDRLGASDQVMANVGDSSPLIALIVTALAAVSILVMSPDAQSWANRLWQRIATAPP